MKKNKFPLFMDQFSGRVERSRGCGCLSVDVSGQWLSNEMNRELDISHPNSPLPYLCQIHRSRS